jgi:hypothetical protein
MNLDLVGHQRFACKLNGLLQQGCGEIRDSDMFGSAIAFSLAQHVERLTAGSTRRRSPLRFKMFLAAQSMEPVRPKHSPERARMMSSMGEVATIRFRG